MIVLLLTIGFGVPFGMISYIIYVAFIKKQSAFGAIPPSDDEVVILKIHTYSIKKESNIRTEIDNLVNHLQWTMGNIGEVRGVDVVNDEIAITIFGESAEEMYTEIRKVLRHTSFSENASVILRYGPPGSPERRTHMAN